MLFRLTKYKRENNSKSGPKNESASQFRSNKYKIPAHITSQHKFKVDEAKVK
jgi:hypothetical protein